uniref:Uncharacterized protein n=1 Tax=Haematobia irritans TaxID=7368 RepID=A0A1L8EB92_HAEIR
MSIKIKSLSINVVTGTGLFSQETSELLIRSSTQRHILPQIWSQVSIGLGNGSISSLGEVTQGASGTTGRSIAILNTSHGQQLLRYGGRYNAGTTRSRNQTYRDGTALAGNLAWHCMGFTDFVTPVTTTHRHYRQFSQDDGTTNGSSNFLAALNTQSNVTVVVTNSNESLEAGTLTSTSLFLDRHNLQYFIAQGRSQEEINDFELFNGQRVQVDFFQGVNFAITNQTAQFGDWNPFLGVFFATTSTTASTATSASTTSTTTRTKSSTETTTGWSCVRHFVVRCKLKR